MKKRYNNKKYKMQSGVQQVYGYTPEEVDYSEANALQAEQDQKIGAVNQGLTALGGKYKAAGQIGSVAGSIIKNRAKNKEAGAMWAGGVETGLSGAAAGANIGEQIMPGYGTVIGAGVGLVGGAIGGAIHGKKTYKKVKSEAQKEESRIAGINAQRERDAAFQSAYGNYTQAQPITAQASLAKKGKYKVKTKQPRLIETEGREPIFSPKKKDGSRDLLYYNPNDPTHAEGGVKAMVMPKAQGGKQKVKAKPKEEYVPLEDDDSIVEEIGEVFDPTGISSYDDVYRSAHNFINKKDKNADDYLDLGLNVFGAVPVIGKAGKLVKLGKTAFKYADKGLDAYKIAQRANRIRKASKVLQEPIQTGNKFTRSIKRMAKTARLGDKVSDAYTILGLGKDFSLYENPEWDRTHSLENAKFLGRRIFPKMSSKNMYPYGAKQLKVNNLNDAALSSNLTGMPAVNSANKFVQPLAGTQQVARNIPEDRRQEKINTPRSHKKSTGPVKTEEPPMLYEMKPPPPRSTFNTKNDFNKGSKKVKVYR